ncbi:MAG: hypothetical protein JXP48_02990 [Acidobacteria bacterium]|nr:hypothetical protein [Acidobacteriota bacterium]
MDKPEIVWAFLPGGIRDGRLKCSAAVSLRLPGESGSKPHLGLFPEILDWAGTVKGLAFEVQFDKSTPVRAVRTSPDPDPELWQAIFRPDSPVIPFRFTDMSRRPVLAFPVRHVQSFIAQQYISMAAESPEEPPEIERVFRSEALAQIRLKPVTSPRFVDGVKVGTNEQILAQSVRSAIAGRKVKAMPVSDKPSPAQDFYLLRLYHRPRNRAVPDSKTSRPVFTRVPVKPPELDFHQAVASLTNYPALMRLLGLAVDFEVPLPSGRRSSGFSARIVPVGRKDDRTPWTRCVLNAAKEVFEAASRSSRPEIVDGFLDLSDGEKFDLVEIDVDGAALKAAELADQAEDQTTGDLPALRSSGFSVARTGNAVALAEALERGAEHHQAITRKRDTTFYAEDIIQGYRVDVWDEASRRWYSLCKRVGSYHFLRADRTETLEDEGFVSDAVTESTDGSSEDLFVHEAIFGWDGWSLVAPRPGRTIDEDDRAADIESRAATAFRLETRFKPVPGSLPRLRFGGRYRLRARAVDLAGNSVGPESPDAAKAIPAPPQAPAFYRRFDPVGSPVVVPRAAPRRGETVDAVVIRSYNDSIHEDTVDTEETAERHVAPPKTSELGAEVHGMFDGAEGGLRKDLYGLIARKDPGKLEEIEPADELELPYFPDPWARGVVVRGLPGLPADQPMRIPFSGDWPEWKPFRIRLAEGDRPAAWDEGARVLTVWLKKSDEAVLRLSCWFPEIQLPNVGLYRWLEKPELAIPPKILQAPTATGPLLVVPPGVQMRAAAGWAPSVAPEPMGPAGTALSKPRGPKRQKEKPPAAGLMKPVFQLPRIQLQKMRDLALNASHWMMTPYRTVVLTHATQQPLGRPGAKVFAVSRNPGDTHAVFDAVLDVHGSSSQKVDLDAAWKEPVDNIAEQSWKTLDGSAHVLEQPLARGMTSFSMKDPALYRQEFGDTKYRRVTYTLTATTRFRDQMPRETAGDVERLVRRSLPITVDVPNTAPPMMPEVLYVVPAFGWERKREKEKFSSIRKGGGLRVYLERPWFSSGDGEQLAVILTSIPGAPTERAIETYEPPAAQGKMQLRADGRQLQAARPAAKVRLTPALKLPPVPEEHKPYVTLWGMDPLWRAGAIPKSEYPGPADFALAAEVLGGLTIPEFPDYPKPSNPKENLSFTAVGHEVAYDGERGLWYCDIEIDPHDAYFPFVRLALARFQPVSVAGAHLSKVVTADFIQLAPDRTVSVTFKGKKPSEMTVTVGGASYVQAAAASGPGTIEIALEAHNVALPDEFGWSELPDTAVTLKAQRISGAGAGQFLWSGKLKIPKKIEFGNHRVVVREYETFLADNRGPAGAKIMATPKGGSVQTRRLVFAETFPLADL